MASIVGVTIGFSASGIAADSSEGSSRFCGEVEQGLQKDLEKGLSAVERLMIRLGRLILPDLTELVCVFSRYLEFVASSVFLLLEHSFFNKLGDFS